MTTKADDAQAVSRRGFLQFTAGLMAAVVAKPVSVFVPPRQPFVYLAPGLEGLYKHLGVLPVSKLSICEGKLLRIGDWDGTGYPCLLRNVCSYPPHDVEAYDFDLWNFRHDDHLLPQVRNQLNSGRWPNWATWYASRRFGSDLAFVVSEGGGPMKRWITGAHR